MIEKEFQNFNYLLFLWKGTNSSILPSSFLKIGFD